MLSYRLFYFERNWQSGEFLPPEAYPESALTAVSTHDLPTLRGYWAGHDIGVRRRLGLFPDDETEAREAETRASDRLKILQALGLGAEGDAACVMTPELSLHIHRHLGRTASTMVAVSLDDILGVLDQQNMPGTIDTHPNWRQKTPEPLEEILKNPLAAELAEMFRLQSRGH